MLTREDLEMLVGSSQTVVDSYDLEKIICSQEDASMQSPGVPAHYYRFLYRLTQITKPKLCLELGTHTGISAACMAEGNHEGIVITVDDKNLLREECRRPNVGYLIQDSLDDVNLLRDAIDILFIDTEHNGMRCLNEYNKFIKFMRPGGLIIFDDISLNEEMVNFWKNFNPSEGDKFELLLHGKAGFGLVLLTQRPKEV